MERDDTSLQMVTPTIWAWALQTRASSGSGTFTAESSRIPIGSPGPQNEVIVIWHTAGITTFKQATEKEIILGGTGEGSGIFIIPMAMNNETDADGKVVEGKAAGSPKGMVLATRFVAWLFDDVHIDFADLARSREAADKKLQALEPGTRAAIFTTSGRTTLDFTADKGKLGDSVTKLRVQMDRGHGEIDACPDVSY